MNAEAGPSTLPPPPSTRQTRKEMSAHASSMSSRPAAPAPPSPAMIPFKKTPSSRTIQLTQAAEKRKKEEKRVLPLRIRGLGAVGGVGSSVTGKEVEDMVYECFVRSKSTEQVPPEDLHITITTQSLTSLQSVQSSSLPANQPSWWSDPIPPLQLPPPPSPAQSMASTSIAASPVVGKKRKPSVVTPVKLLGGFGKDRVVMPGFRRITAQDDILPDEKRRTRGAEVISDQEDSSDAHYHTLHAKYERLESRARLAERNKIEHARYKLLTRIEYLEGMNDDVWAGIVARLLQRGKRGRKQEEGEGQASGSVSGQVAAGQDPGSSRLGGNNGIAEESGKKKEEKKSVEQLRWEQQEKDHLDIMQAGERLLARLTMRGLRQELIREGKDLLGRYDRVLSKSGDKANNQNGHADRSGRSISRAVSRASTMTPPPRAASLDVPEARNLTIKKRKSRLNASDSEEDDYTPNKKYKKVNRPAPQPPIPSVQVLAALDEDEDVEPAQPMDLPLNPTPIPAVAPKKPKEPTSKASQPRITRKSHAFPPGYEPFYPPQTESGKPALIEAAEKRLTALEQQEKARELFEKAKASGKVRASDDGPRTSRISRAEAILPFGVTAPKMLGWRIEYDLDGESWWPLLAERGYGPPLPPPVPQPAPVLEQPEFHHEIEDIDRPVDLPIQIQPPSEPPSAVAIDAPMEDLGGSDMIDLTLEETDEEL